MGMVREGIYVHSATRLQEILAEVLHLRPRAVIIDSIQTVYLDDVNGSSGSVSQVCLVCIPGKIESHACSPMHGLHQFSVPHNPLHGMKLSRQPFNLKLAHVWLMWASICLAAMVIAMSQ